MRFLGDEGAGRRGMIVHAGHTTAEPAERGAIRYPARIASRGALSSIILRETADVRERTACLEVGHHIRR